VKVSQQIDAEKCDYVDDDDNNHIDDDDYDDHNDDSGNRVHNNTDTPILFLFVE
jgi:hypothetical protein